MHRSRLKLTEGTKIGRYEILSLLGTGGMGEVYLAHDGLLGRDVALKMLKHSDDPDRLQRFRREAKVVSTLNHPNILTVYDFGEYEDSLYIISELVRGENLRDIISEKNLSLSEILDIGIQTANALVVAHEAGIVHRDIKPENIMILPDGYVKVLDFGLAKFVGVDNDLTRNPEASTVSLIETKRGLIIGTVNYMSPEQLRGQPVDERIDIWSLGAVLYELVTKRRPFTGESVSDVIAAVLERPVVKISEIVENLPVELDEIICQALEKDKTKRFQNAKDFAAELKHLKLQVDTQISTELLIPSLRLAGKQNTKTVENRIDTVESGSLAVVPLRRKIMFSVAAIVLGLVLIGGTIFLYPVLFSEQQTNKQMKIRRLQTAGNVTNAAISPDGKFVAVVQTENGQNSLWLRQTDETGGKELIAPSFGNYSGLTFSPDGNSIFFTVFEQGSLGKLYRIPILGGTRQEILKDIDSAVAFSPDGKQLTFIRNNLAANSHQVIISDVDGSNQRVLLEKKPPEYLTITARETPAWSPDGKTIACPVDRNDAESDTMSLIEINVETGQEKAVTGQKWFRIGAVAYTKSADALIITAADLGSDFFQVVRVNRTDGKTSAVTKDLSDYYRLTITADASRILGLAYDKTSSLYMASADTPEQTRQITGGGFEGAEGVIWTSDGRIVFTSMESGNRDIWLMDGEGKNRSQLTFDKASDEYPSISKDGKIVFVSTRAGTPHVWQMNSDGAGLSQLTKKGGETFPSITPDGKTVIFSSPGEVGNILWKITTENGAEAVRLTNQLTRWSAVSPDGKTVACLSRKPEIDKPIELSIVSIEDGKFLKTFSLPGGVASPTIVPTIRWTQDGKSVGYVATTNGVSNLWRQAIDGGEPQKITNFSAERIFSFDWSADGKQIIYARGVVRSNMVLLEDF